MRFWEDMQSKWGFSDGDAIPTGIEAYRTVYIRAVNRLAEQLDSQVRAVAFNRAGLHNFCLILFHRVDDLKDIPVKQYTEHVDIQADVVEPDEAMQEAVRQAYDLRLDEWIHVTVEIDPDLDEVIENLKPIDEDGPLIVIVQGEAQHIYLDAQVEVISTTWLAEHAVVAEDNAFTVTAVYHRDEMVTIRSRDERHLTVPAQLVRVLHIPEAYREHNRSDDALPEAE